MTSALLSSAGQRSASWAWGGPPPPGTELFASVNSPGWGPPKGFSTYQKGKRWKEGGKTNFYFLFGLSGTAEGQGTGGRRSLTVFKPLCKKQHTHTHKQLALYIAEGRPSPRLTIFPWSWGEATLKGCVPGQKGGLGPARPSAACLLSRDLCGCGGPFTALMS